MLQKALILLLPLLAATAAQSATETPASPPESPGIAQVWQREADYWRFVQAGDVESYVTLWHDRFIGWPCGKEHPVRKAAIGDWVREVRDKHLKLDVNLTREGAEDFGDVVVVHYQFTRVNTYPDGKVEGLGEVSKITHTWMMVGNDWLIIGGMCGKLSDAATTR